VSSLLVPWSCASVGFSLAARAHRVPVAGLVLPAAGVRLVVFSCRAWRYYVRLLVPAAAS
jgi:hypothetical protein